jgi:voltage-gated potassium channel
MRNIKLCVHDKENFMSAANGNEKPKGVVHHHSNIYNLFILVLTIFSIIVAGGIIISPNNAIFWWVDFLICVFFIFDFMASFWRAPNRTNYFIVKGGWLDLLGAIPTVPGLTWTVIFRLARLNRGVRIIKHFQGKDRDDVIDDARQTPAKTALLTMTITAIMLVTVASLTILRLEQGAADAQILNGRDAFWWSMVTITSVGYGDYVPVTFWGRILATILMIFGIGIFAVLTSFVAARVVSLQRDPEEIIEIVKSENAAIRAELAELEELIQNQENKDDDG